MSVESQSLIRIRVIVAAKESLTDHFLELLPTTIVLVVNILVYQLMLILLVDKSVLLTLLNVYYWHVLGRSEAVTRNAFSHLV